MGDPDPAGDPHLIVAALAVVKTTEWSGSLAGTLVRSWS
jgi:hypothetical protein